MFDLWLLAFAVPVLIIAGIIALIVKVVSLPKGEKFDPLRWKKFGLGLAIALIFPFMIMYSFATFTTISRYDRSYEQQVEPDKKYNNLGGGYKYFAPNGESITLLEYEMYFEIYSNVRAEQQLIYKNNVQFFHTVLFVTMVGFGLIAIVAGLFMEIPAASTGILFGGTTSIVFGFIDYLSYMNEVTIFITLLVALLALIFVAYKKFNKTDTTP